MSSTRCAQWRCSSGSAGPWPAQDQPCSGRPCAPCPIYATVIEASGRLVPDLERDFTILDDGKPVEVTLFSNESQPFTAVVMLDTSASMTANLDLLNRAAEQFLLRLLPVDRAQVGAFNDKIQMSGTFTNNRDSLIAALKDLQFGNPTRLNDAIAASLDALEGHRRPPRRAGVHRRRRHVEQDRIPHRARSRAQRRSDGLLDRSRIGILQRHARCRRGRRATCARSRTKPAAATSN